MASGSSCSSSFLGKLFVSLLVVTATLSPVFSLPSNQTFRPQKELHKLRRIRAHLEKINKPAVKTIQACSFAFLFCFEYNLYCVPSHIQPAFDHPELKGQKPLDLPESHRPNGYDSVDEETQSIQQWAMSGESCPNGTIPIRRTTEEDVLRATNFGRFGRKPRRMMRRDSEGSGHEHAVAIANGQQFYGAKASMNVWTPQVNPALYGDKYPRFFTYWTTDAYQATGCYNLLCSGFVQTNSKIAIGAAISPRSSFIGRQYDISITDPKHGHWWLQLGSGVLVGYWPAFLFSHLRMHANMIQFGGEVVNSRSSGFHTATQMGSGHFADEGFRKAAYFRNLQAVDWDNNLIPLSNLKLLADHPNCYNIRQGKNNAWGNYFYYGGPGRNVRCP
ncbi:hypothetical protein RDABS01_019246 [Bienertia sinuspersici]